MNSLFTYKNEKEGKIGIGKIPIHLHNTLNEIAKEYKIMIPDKKYELHTTLGMKICIKY
jgi:hypothetical protein